MSNGEDSWLNWFMKSQTRNPDKTKIIHELLTDATLLFGFNQAVYFELTGDKKYFVGKQAIGPITREEYFKIVPSTLGKSREELQQTNPFSLDSRLNEMISTYHVSREERGVFQGVYDSKQSHLGLQFEPTEEDRKLIEYFGTGNFAAISIKGRNEEVIGILYGNRKFSGELISPENIDLSRYNARDYIAPLLTMLRLEEENKALKMMDMQKMLLAEAGMQSGQTTHEIRKFMAIIGGNARRVEKLIKEKRFGERSGDEMLGFDNLGTIISSVGDAESFLNGRLREMKNSYNLKPSPNYYDIREDVERCLKEIKAGAEQDVDYRMSSDRLVVYADRNLIYRIIHNLISNAYDAMTGDSKNYGGDHNCITVKLERNTYNAFIHFHNTQRIPDNIQPFTPFSTSKKNGTGLGLPISRRFADVNGGSLEYTVNSSGTTFTLTLPLSPTTYTAQQPSYS